MLNKTIPQITYLAKKSYLSKSVKCVTIFRIHAAGDCALLFSIFGIDDYPLINRNKIVNKLFKLSCKTKILELVSSCILADCRVKIELLPRLWQLIYNRTTQRPTWFKQTKFYHQNCKYIDAKSSDGQVTWVICYRHSLCFINQNAFPIFKNVVRVETTKSIPQTIYPWF